MARIRREHPIKCAQFAPGLRGGLRAPKPGTDFIIFDSRVNVAACVALNFNFMITITSSGLRFFSLLAHILHRNQEGNTLSNKPLSWVDFFFPYHLSLNSNLKQLELKKRNWFGIGVDTKTFNYGQVRNVLIDEHIITASIEIRVYAGRLSAHWLSKSDARRFRDRLMMAKSGGEDIGMFLE